MSDNVIAVNQLRKQFDANLAVADVSFVAEQGKTTALLGGNGAGKTTTIAMLLGLLIPTSGSIHIFGQDMLTSRYDLLYRMNFSSPYADLPQRLTARENLTVYAHLYRLKHVKTKIKQLMETLNLNEFIDRPYGRLSAGQKTRVSLAKSLLNEPELLLLDEPTASLDPDTADAVRSHLEHYQKRTGATIVLASHNMGEVERLASSVIMLKKGKVVDSGSPDELIARYGHDNMEDVFIEIARQPNLEVA